VGRRDDRGEEEVEGRLVRAEPVDHGGRDEDEQGHPRSFGVEPDGPAE
jgi:hypothetical protein